MGLLERDSRKRLIEALLRLPNSKDRSGRDLLLQDLPFNLVSSIERQNSALLDIASIVNTTDSDNWAKLLDGTPSVQIIIQNALDMAPDERTATELQTLLKAVQSQAGGQAAEAATRGLDSASPAPTSPPSQSPVQADGDKPLVLDGRQLRRLQQIILAAFPDRGSLARMVRFGMDAQLEQVTAGTSPSDMAFDLIMWAESQDRLAPLIQAAQAARPDDPDLQAFAREVRMGPSGAAINAPPAPPVPLSIDDRDRLINLLFNTPPLQSAEALVLFLRRAGVADSWLSNYSWGGPPRAMATQLVTEAERQQYPLWARRPGYTVLGLILDRLLREEAVGYDDGRYLARLIRDNKLIDRSKATISPELQSLLNELPPG